MARGDYPAAIALFEKLWDFRGAYRAALAAEDLPRALRYAIDLADEPALRSVLALMTTTDDGTRAALDVLGKLRRHAEAAPLAERLGDLPRAIDHYTRAHDEINAARLLELEGKDREAGKLLERALDFAAPSE